jgi:hypothetical protein
MGWTCSLNEIVSGRWETGTGVAVAGSFAAAGVLLGSADALDAGFWHEVTSRQAESPPARRWRGVEKRCIFKRVS